MLVQFRKYVVATLMLALPLSGHAQGAEPDDIQDHPLVKRFPNSQIIGFDQRDKDSLEFVTAASADGKEPAPRRNISGRVTTLVYQAASHQDSVAAIFEGFQKQFQALGAEAIFSCANADCGTKFVPDLFGAASRKRLYLPLAPWNVVTPHSNFRYWNGTLSQGGSRYHFRLLVATPSYADYPPKIALDVVESQMSIEELPGMSMETLSEALREAGRVALEYVNFQTDSAKLPFEASKTLKTVAEYLRQRPSQQVFLVGHTALGKDYGKSLELSKARAQAVVDDLVQRLGVAPEQVKAVGVGPVSPLVNNADQLGRLRNNRVELVLGTALRKE